jgi:hypothetical protein
MCSFVQQLKAPYSEYLPGALERGGQNVYRRCMIFGIAQNCTEREITIDEVQPGVLISIAFLAHVDITIEQLP